MGKRRQLSLWDARSISMKQMPCVSMLENAGVIITDAGDEPDIYIVNTCSVTNMAERKSRQMLHRAKRKNPNVIVVAVGCYAQVGKEELAADGHIDLIIGNNKRKIL